MNPVARKEELLNAISHGIGAALSVAALVLLIVFASLWGNVWHIVGFTIFGTTLVLLYTSSTLYHSFHGASIKELFRKFDHISIFLLIAGTYTPFCLAVLDGWIGWTIFGVVWGCTAAGVVLKAFFTGKKELLSTILYVALGWIVLPVIKTVYENTSATTFALLLAGGAFYTAGTFFFINHRIRYNHSIWHMFVLAGSVCHFFSVISLLP